MLNSVEITLHFITLMLRKILYILMISNHQPTHRRALILMFLNFEKKKMQYDLNFILTNENTY